MRERIDLQVNPLHVLELAKGHLLRKQNDHPDGEPVSQDFTSADAHDAAQFCIGKGINQEFGTQADVLARAHQHGWRNGGKYFSY